MNESSALSALVNSWASIAGGLFFVLAFMICIYYTLIKPAVDVYNRRQALLAQTPPTPPTFENVYTSENLKEPLIAAINEVMDILVHHSGPFASNSLIGSRYRQVNDVDEFTKDGINILKHVLVSEDVSARVMVRLARYVGIAVDARCHDGTTTSMLMMCALVRIAIDKIDQGFLSQERYDWVRQLEAALDECLVHIEDLKITEEDLLARCERMGVEATGADIRGAIAYHMALISSKGDHDLATKISHIIRSSPKKIYGMYRNIPLAIETEEPYILKRQEYDLLVRGNLGHADHFNYKNDTQYLAPEAVIFATANSLSVHSMESGFLQAFISTNPRIRADLTTYGVSQGWEAFHENKRHLVIIAPSMDDPGLIETINKFNYEHPHMKISWFTAQLEQKLRTSFNKTLHYMAGVPTFDEIMFNDALQSLIGLGDTRPRVSLIGSTLGITNLYKRDGEVFHPLYRNPEAFKPYTDFCRETEEIIEFAQKNVTNPALDANELTMLTSYYRSLTCQEIWDIEVGGSRHDQRANQTVYEDAIGAALSAINEGVVLGGYAHLANIFRPADGFENNEMDEMFHEAFSEIVIDSLRIEDAEDGDRLLLELDDYQYADDRKWSFLVAERGSYRPGAQAQDYVRCYDFGKGLLASFLERNNSVPVLLQAYAGYHEQFKRFRDILPKFANTSHLVDMRNKTDVGGN